jgi:predicted dehydrogenase
MIQTEQENKALALGFIGIGWIGRNRMEVLLKSGKAEAAILVEPDSAQAEAALLLADGAELTPSPEDVYQDPDLDGVVIATPSAMHAAQAEAALLSRKAVFCQKPLGRTAEEVKKVVNAAAMMDKLLAVDLSYRYTRAFRELYQLIKSGDLGHIYAVELVFHNAYGPDKNWFYDINQSGGGCVMDLGIHLIDLAMWCLDFPEVKDIKSNLYSKGKLIREVGSQVEDFAKVSMMTEQDTAISLECSWHVSAGKDAEIAFRCYGTTGGASFHNINGSFFDFKSEKYHGTKTHLLMDGQDDWSGRAGLDWADQVLSGKGHDAKTASEFIHCAEIIDKIYGRKA